MKIETIVTLDQEARNFLADLKKKLQSVCTSTFCEGFSCSRNCPLDKISDKAHDLADEISVFLANSK